MNAKEIKVVFQPSGRTVFVMPGTLLLEAAGLAGIVFQAPCGGKGTCGKCKVRVNGRDVLACQATVDKDSVVDVPVESMFESRQSILVADSGDTTLVRKPRVGFVGALGVAFDIGTTTVVGTLFDLAEGRELAVEAALNGQISFGDDVISRIQVVCEKPDAIFDLKDAILGTVNALIGRLCDQAGVRAENIQDITIAGNSTMQQILCGLDISGLGSIPFRQAFHEAQILSAVGVGLKVSAEAQVYVFPQIDGFVGGDTVAGMLASRIDQRDGVVLFIDIGTNGEIVLLANGKLHTASTAAGPAFEGARITQGMRATVGAIEKVVIDSDVQYNVIGDVRPAGLCGSALIDAVAGLLDAGVIDDTGRIQLPDELNDGVSAELKKRLIVEAGRPAFVIADGCETANGKPICVWQKDVRELQLATGAIRAGSNILLRQAGLSSENVDEVLLAGAFGNFIRRNHARRIGLLPQLSCECIKFIGNAASLGAKLALLSVDERDYAEKLRQRTQHVDLSKDPMFQMEFAEAMMFPAG